MKRRVRIRFSWTQLGYDLQWIYWSIREHIDNLGYLIRPYDDLADARRWFWQPRQPCGRMTYQRIDQLPASYLRSEMDRVGAELTARLAQIRAGIPLLDEAVLEGMTVEINDDPYPPLYHGPMNPVHPCREMETRHCPAIYDGPCGNRPCARFESNDPTPWTAEPNRPGDQ